MKFNASKSKVMVIGKLLDKNKEWKLGNSMLIETNINLAALYCHVSGIPLKDKADGIHTALP
jgi:hypothetical protein